MPRFTYTGRDKDRQAINGVMDAASPLLVAESLANMGVTPVNIDLKVEVATAQDTFSRLFGKRSINHQQLQLLTRQLYTLTKAGVPLLQALKGLRDSSAEDGLREIYQQLMGSLDEGYDLSQAMGRRSDVFDTFYVSMVRVGESTGRLTEVFLNLSDHLEFQRYMKQQVDSAVRYPKFVIAAMVIALAVITVFVIPSFSKVFASMKTELPLMTRILLGSSEFVVSWWPAMVMAVMGLIFAAKLHVATPGGRLQWDRVKLKLPVAGKVMHKGVLARVSRSLALVLQSGIPVVQGLVLTTEVVDNAYIAQALVNLRTSVERGESVLMASNRAGIFTPLVLQMIMVGEETGRLDEMLGEIGQMYQREVEYELKTMSQQIEPILIMVLGAMVLVLALGVFMPMWDLGRAALK
ncbi:type II secretion system F family protein [Aquabacterium sp.]|uniref:type II secretion system F family protein n=1 Tax=Aquabacterium sp. TaxID=1872578 RepID=UPI0024876C36|nr:type II secretion system F family protein [Aquabacterium sp.]MDI1259084.1 type II secretion system F family protein [Aquabacterium sp.]